MPFVQRFRRVAPSSHARTPVSLPARAAAASALPLLLLVAACSAAGPDDGPTASTSQAIIPVRCGAHETKECYGDILCSPGVPPHCYDQETCVCVPDPWVPFPAIPTLGGATLPELQLASVVFSGDTQFDGTSTAAGATSFSNFIVHSQWLQTVTAPYRASPSTPFAATNLGTYVLPAYAGGTVDVPTLLANGVAAATLPSPVNRPGLVYQVFVPPAGCGGGDSYHSTTTIAGQAVVYAVECGDDAFGPGQAGPSHEIIEAITDPSGSGYAFGQDSYSSTAYESAWLLQGEVADACEGTVVDETSATYGTYRVAAAWSNTAVQTSFASPCVPAPAWYFNLTPSGALTGGAWDTSPIPVTHGAKATVDLTLWMTGSAPASTTVHVFTQGSGTAGPNPTTLDGVAGATGISMQAGADAALVFTAPATPGPVFIDVVSAWTDASGTPQSSVWPLSFSVN